MKLNKTDFARWGWLVLAACAASVLDVVSIYIVPDLQKSGGTMALVATSLILIIDLLRRYVTDTRVIKTLIFALLIAIPSGLFAQTLNIPQQVPEHTLVKAMLDPKSEGLVMWDVYSVSSYKDVETETLERDGQSYVIFTGSPGNYLVKVRIVSSKEGKLFVSYQKDSMVTIGNSVYAPVVNPVNPVTPTPVVVPTPVVIPPSPKPVVPKPQPAPGRLGYSGTAYNEAIKLADKNLVGEIADNFESIAASINAGGIKSVTIAFNEVSAANSKTIGNVVNKEAWKPFFDAVDVKFKADVKSGVLSKLSTIAEAFMEIAEGLRAA